eukprot:606528_1
MERYYHKTSSMLTMKFLLFIVLTVRIGMSYGSEQSVPSHPFNVLPLTALSMPTEGYDEYMIYRAARHLPPQVLRMFYESRNMSRKKPTPSIPEKYKIKIRIPKNSGSKLNLKIFWNHKYNVKLSYKTHSDDKSVKLKQFSKAHKKIAQKTKHSQSMKLQRVLNTNKKPAQKRGVKRSNMKPDCIDLTAEPATEDEHKQSNTSDTLETDFKHMIDESIRMRKSMLGRNKFMHPGTEESYPSIPCVGLNIVTDNNYVGDYSIDGTHSVMSASANTQTYSTNTNDDVEMPDTEKSYVWRDLDPTDLTVVEEYDDSRILFIYKASDDDKN